MAPTVSASGYDLVGKIGHLAVYLGTILVLYIVYKVVYNIYFHPLARFPGPKFAAMSNAWVVLHSTSGNYHHDLVRLHDKYGPVVRIAPNELDFSTAQSYQDIHGHAKQGRATFLKSDSYITGSESDVGIVSARDPAIHREIRKSLAHAFSAKALRLQEKVVMQYINLLVNQIHKRESDEEGLNLQQWYNWLTFDIIGDLAFGESFDAVRSGKGHPWISLILDAVHLMGYMDAFRRFPILQHVKKLCMLMMPKDLKQKSAEHFQLSMSKAVQRMERGNNDRDDFFSHLLREKDNGPKITPEYILAQSTTLIVAGSETTATFLIGVTYYLLNSSQTLRHLQDEVRSAFSDSESINSDSTASLKYLCAVIEEGLRLYPPVPTGLPRDSPGAMVDGNYVPKGAVVGVSGYVATHNEEAFKDASEFHPERWLPSDHPLYNPRYKDDVKDAHKPFSLGPRACLGINLAYMEMRIVLARMTWEFDWELITKDLVWERDSKLYVLWRKPELRVKFTSVRR